MLGWNIKINRQTDGDNSPATADSRSGTELAVWQTSVAWPEWIDGLLKAGKAVALGGTGYPFRYTAQAKQLIPIMENPPDANRTWICGDNDILLPSWKGETTVDTAAIGQCRPDEWLIIEIWDES